MKKLLLAALMGLLCQSFTPAQNLKTDSIYNWGKTGWELPADMVADADGNYYITGSFSGEMTIGGQQVKSNGRRDLFLAKFSKDNQFQWAKNMGGEGDDNAYSLLIQDNKIYLAGSFRKQLDFNKGTISLKGKGLTDVFLAQLGPDGTIQWAKAITSQAPAQKAFLQADSQGNIWIAGSFSKPIETASTVLNTGDKKGVYALSFGTDGKLLQNRYFTGDSEVGLNGFSINREDEFYFAGPFSGNLQISGKSISSNGKTDGYLASMDNEGNASWTINLGGSYDDEIKSMALDEKGNIYVAGDFKYSIELDKAYTALQNTDAFVAKYSPDGKLAWSFQLGAEGESYNTVTDLEMAGEDKFFLSGAFRGKLQNNPTVQSEGNSKNAFLARYSTNGQKDWVLGTRSANESKLWIKSNPKTKGLFISGYFSETFKLGDYEIKNKNYKDIFFGSLTDCDLAPKVSLGPDSTLCKGISIKAKGNFAKYLWNTGQDKDSILPQNSGEYTVTATDKHGCVSSDTINIQILPAPEIDLGTDAVICQGQNKTLLAKEGYNKYQWDNGNNTNQRTLTETGIYWLQVSDSLGCQATDSLILTVNPLPEFDLGQTIELPVSDSLKLEPMLTDGKYTYQWSTGQNTKTVCLPMKIFSKPTVLSLTVTDPYKCSFTDQVLVIQNNKLVSGNENGQDAYKVYPNPTNGKVYIMPTGIAQAKRAEVYNVRGTLVKTITDIQNFPLEIDLSGLGKGTYLVKISEEKQSREFRVVVE